MKKTAKRTKEERREMDNERRAKAQGIAPAIAKDLSNELYETGKRFRDIISLIESKRITPEIKSELLLAGLEMADNFLHFWKVERQIFSKALYPPEYEEAIKAEREAAEAKEANGGENGGRNNGSEI